ncbi:class I SAM-dependent methyltransferase [Endozoicomonas atrinae]|uniref:class I SAM-dependent methyltransferase n=1 Tax=Endozoicomonas atrinae TaxID=1333660 RepID=UPI003AFFCB32
MDNFFQQWRTYRTIVTHGYMGHKGVADSILRELQQWPQQGLDILDLGCGDAEVFFRLLPELKVNAYKGVDSSAAALDVLTERFNSRDVTFQLYCQDMMDFLSSYDGQFDIILAGFCMHHLSFDEKKRCLQMAYRCLREHGVMFIYDIFLQPGESRDQYLSRYLAYMHSNWAAMSTLELEAAGAHITGCDFPEEVEVFRQWSEAVGFEQIRSLWEGEWHSHKLLQLKRGA